MTRVLLADEEDALYSMLGLLQSCGHEVTAVSFVEGIEEALTKNEFDILVIEPFIPTRESFHGITASYPGLKVFEKLARTKKIPIIVGSTFSFAQPIEWYKIFGASILKKPYSYRQLDELIREKLA